MLYTGIPSGWDPSSCLPIQREARAERLSVWRRSLPPVREDLRRGWGRRPARREEDAAAGDEPCAVSSCYIEDLVCVASRQQHIVAKPPAGDTSTKRGGASVARARERSDGGGRLAGAREGRGGGGGSRIRGMERRRWPEPGEGGARRRRWLEPGEIGGGSGCRRWCRVHLILCKYHLLRGKNHMIPYKYHLILHKHHMIRDRNRLIPYRYQVSPDTSQVSPDTGKVSGPDT
ncbi:Os03g0100700 [Oryza sativa Japonica Group]|uniref:Os03g0100700 protein n=1 Tax=Oryza sativa subsp. japonica TaxID=39947 RepID=A0A0P0VRU6_ORYSJ|nr:Os03g0100700 [Oryza sativa Japonica Group]